MNFIKFLAFFSWKIQSWKFEARQTRPVRRLTRLQIVGNVSQTERENLHACRWMSQRQQQLSNNRKCSKSARRSANIKNILFWWKICSVDSDMFSSLSPPWTQSLLKNNPESSFQAAFKLSYNVYFLSQINGHLNHFSKITTFLWSLLSIWLKKKKENYFVWNKKTFLMK